LATLQVTIENGHGFVSAKTETSDEAGRMEEEVKDDTCDKTCDDGMSETPWNIPTYCILY
jgi:hypothetical protein